MVELQSRMVEKRRIGAVEIEKDDPHEIGLAHLFWSVKGLRVPVSEGVANQY